MNITYKRLSLLNFEDALALFNKGFEGYLIPMHLTMEQFVGRFGNEGLSVELSVVAFDGNTPIGFILQGIRENDGVKISWNGGTGIIPEYRGKGVGLHLMKEAERILVENEVAIATLEALSENEPAIKLYEKCGYEIQDKLVFLSGSGKLIDKLPELGEYELERFPAFLAIGSDLFPTLVPWQTAESVVPKVGGEVVNLLKDGEIRASCLIRKRGIYNNPSEGITLFQVTSGDEQHEVNILLAHALEYDQPVSRSTYNFMTGKGNVVSLLQESGFENTAISQVFMLKKY
ncbi:GNAT family N-acetyltransferase [Paenisporosarcina sp. FSL H8-0542]|uniref:GNAT family N-acetyltransferase n=1 Tax=Paenisporosarcina sp. FSL H8-0542 TaxID=2921401 RepID=UPI00315A757E